MDGDTPDAAQLRPAEQTPHRVIEFAHRRRWRLEQTEAAARAAREAGVHLDELALARLRRARHVPGAYADAPALPGEPYTAEGEAA